MQLLAPFGITAAGAHPRVHGADELARHVRERDAPVLTMSSQVDVPGTVLRRLIDPVAAYPWSMIWRAELRHGGLDALHQAIDQLARAQRWLELPEAGWLPQPA